jgi:hypothetical protein
MNTGAGHAERAAKHPSLQLNGRQENGFFAALRMTIFDFSSISTDS